MIYFDPGLLTDENPVLYLPLTQCSAGMDFSEFEQTITQSPADYGVGPSGVPYTASTFMGDDDSGAVVVSTSDTLDTTYSITILMHVYVEEPGNIINFGVEAGHGMYLLISGDTAIILYTPLQRGTDGVSTFITTF